MAATLPLTSAHAPEAGSVLRLRVVLADGARTTVHVAAYDSERTELRVALLGLRAHGEVPPEADGWLAAATDRIQARDGAPHKLALVALAAKGWPA